MRVGIDYTAAVRQGGGIGRYTRNLVRSLASLDAENGYALLVAGGWGEGDGLGQWPTNFRVRSVPLSDRWMHILWQRLRLPVPVQVITGPLDLFHSPDFVLPPVGRTPAVLTVHDLSFLRVPEHFVPGFREYLEDAVTRAVTRARHILADSESTRLDVMEVLGVASERVTVIYPGVESRFERVIDPGRLEQVRARYQLPERFILGLGTLQPRKNFQGLVRAFEGLLRDRGEEPEITGVDLVIAGGRGWMYEELMTVVTASGLGDRVHFPGFVDDADLPTLYSLASVFAFPTWYEGFGIPVVEAMACGTPVVASNNSSLPEAVGEAGLMVNASDIAGLADAVASVLLDDDLRERLVNAGYEQAKRFQWEQSAQQVLEIYESFA